MAKEEKPVEVSRSATAKEEGGRLPRAEDVAGLTGLSIETLTQWRSQRRGFPS
jgi:hypothetical protein